MIPDMFGVPGQLRSLETTSRNIRLPMAGRAEEVVRLVAYLNEKMRQWFGSRLYEQFRCAALLYLALMISIES